MSKAPSPLDIFDYCYGVLYDPTYRAKYNDFLKRDYPRVPVITDDAAFAKYKLAGSRLRKLHLLQEKAPADLQLIQDDSKNMQLDTPKYKDGALFINKNTQIISIAPAVWAYRIGGYQVLDKWFKSHKGEVFDIEKFEHVCNVAGLIAETIQVQEGMKKDTPGDVSLVV